jgi:Family of unknown function (DUF5996)
VPDEPFPPMPLDGWRETRETLHRFLQIVGKVRMAASPRRNHWWHVPLYVTARGLTTSPMRAGGRIFDIDMDLVDGRLEVRAATGESRAFALPGLSVAAFHERLTGALASLGLDVAIRRSRPFDLGDDTPFADDDQHDAWDAHQVRRYAWILTQVDALLKEFAGRFDGKTSPVHHFWHTMDIAVTRFSGRRADLPDGVDPVTREAYSHEVVSFGFWFGDDATPAPAFYSYTAPEPAGLADEPLRPEQARWQEGRGSHLAILVYDDARSTPAPGETVLDFWESAWEAGTRRAGWPGGLSPA